MAKQIAHALAAVFSPGLMSSPGRDELRAHPDNQADSWRGAEHDNLNIAVASGFAMQRSGGAQAMTACLSPHNPPAACSHEKGEPQEAPQVRNRM